MEAAVMGNSDNAYVHVRCAVAKLMMQEVTDAITWASACGHVYVPTMHARDQTLMSSSSSKISCVVNDFVPEIVRFLLWENQY